MGSTRRCLTCKVLFETINALNNHCALTAHPVNAHQCRPCNRAFATAYALQSHLASRLHVRRSSRTQISAQRTQAGATQPIPVTPATNADEVLNLNNCSRCELTFKNHELLLEHYRTSSMHRFCLVCFQVFPSKELLDQHITASLHLQNRVLRIPKFIKKKAKTTTTPRPIRPGGPPPDANLLAIPPIEPTSRPELIEEEDDDDFILIEKSSLPSSTIQSPRPVITIHQTKNTDATLPTNFLLCPGCQKRFHLFSTFVLHIEIGACSSSSKSRQISAEINALAAQLFRNLSIV